MRLRSEESGRSTPPAFNSERLGCWRICASTASNTMTTDDFQSKAQISELVHRWAFCRDNARWNELASTFAEDGVIAVSWFNGQHSDFVEASRARHGRSFNQHLMLGTLSEVRGDRAWAESTVQMIGHGSMQATPVRWQCHFRMIDLCIRHKARWLICRRTAVYDMDHLVSDSAAALVLDEELLNRLPRAYRYLGYRLRVSGLDVLDDVPTAGSAAEASLRDSGQQWLNGA
jgi:hypothetical protein